jgi:FkbM family methyltransferase
MLINSTLDPNREIDYPVQRHPTGLFYRVGTYDEAIIQERKTYSHLEITPDDTVLDIGGCIGSFAYHALVERQARKVISFEPDPQNSSLFTRWRSQLSAELQQKLQLYQCAVTPHHTDIAHLYVNEDGMNKGLHSTEPRRGRPFIEVSAYPFEQALHYFEPTILKIDIEGGEFDLLQLPLPSHVRSLAVELHRGRESWRSIRIPETIRTLSSQGFTPVKAPADTGWATLGIWRR